MSIYTDKETIERYMLTAIDASFDTQVDEWIETASEIINRKTGRTFDVPATASEKVYDGNGKSCMIVDDFIDRASLEITIDDDAVDDEDIFVYPANSNPKTEVRLKSGAFYKGFHNIAITAKWGYDTAIPDPIKWACTVLVAGIINFSNSQDGEVQSETIGRYSVTYKGEKQLYDYQEALKIIDLYTRY